MGSVLWWVACEETLGVSCACLQAEVSMVVGDGVDCAAVGPPYRWVGGCVDQRAAMRSTRKHIRGSRCGHAGCLLRVLRGHKSRACSSPKSGIPALRLLHQQNDICITCTAASIPQQHQLHSSGELHRLSIRLSSALWTPFLTRAAVTRFLLTAFCRNFSQKPFWVQIGVPCCCDSSPGYRSSSPTLILQRGY